MQRYLAVGSGGRSGSGSGFATAGSGFCPGFQCVGGGLGDLDGRMRLQRKRTLPVVFDWKNNTANSQRLPFRVLLEFVTLK